MGVIGMLFNKRSLTYLLNTSICIYRHKVVTLEAVADEQIGFPRPLC